MALDLDEVTYPVTQNPVRSAIDLTRRMMLLRWSRGRYLDTVTGNYGLRRPPIGFSDDDLYRAAAQVIMVDQKNIRFAFWQVLEILLGPYENLVFNLDTVTDEGDGYFTLARDINYVKYSAWNSTDFIPGETLTNAVGQRARFRYHDKDENKIHLDTLERDFSVLSAPAYDEAGLAVFLSGQTMTGTTSGGSVTLSSATLRQVSDEDRWVSDRMPLYGNGVVSDDFRGTSEGSTAQTITLPAEAIDTVDFYKGWTLQITSGAASGDTRTVESYDPVTRALKVTAVFSATPDTASSFILTATEDIVFVMVDKFLRRVRVRDDFEKSFSSDAVLYIKGGCWDLINAMARRIALHLKCEDVTSFGIPGNSYLHRDGYSYARLRSPANGTTTLEFDNSVVDAVPTTFDLTIDPEDENAGTEYVTVSTFTPGTLTASLSFSTTKIHPAGTLLKWLQRDEVTGGLSTAASPVTPPTVQTIKANSRYEDVLGLWILDEGGGNEELVFVTGTTFQKRRLTSQITPSATIVRIDYPFDNIKEGTQTPNLILRVYDISGYLGDVAISSVKWYVTTGVATDMNIELTLAGAPAFSSDIANKYSWVELVETTGGEVTLTLSSPLANSHIIGTTFARHYGTAAPTPTTSDHVAQAGWPPPATPTGRWPGPYTYTTTQRAPVFVKETAASTLLAQAFVARNNANDCRIYLGNTVLARDFDPGSAPTTLLPQSVVETATFTSMHQPYDIQVADASAFPSTTLINNWRIDPTNPNPAFSGGGFPIRVVLGGEGGFGRTPLYYWGKKGTTGNEEHVIFVSGIQRTHAAGTTLATFHEQIPVEASVAGILGGSLEQSTAAGQITSFSFTQSDINHPGASTTNGFYVGFKIELFDGTGSGQIRDISAYDGGAKRITISQGWGVLPDATTEYRLYKKAVFPLSNSIVILGHTQTSEELARYETLNLETNTRALMEFERGFIPDHSHDPYRFYIPTGALVGTPVIRTSGNIGDNIPLKNGFSFSFILDGNVLLYQLALILEKVRAAGVEISFYDSDNRQVNTDIFQIF